MIVIKVYIFLPKIHHSRHIQDSFLLTKFYYWSSSFNYIDDKKSLGFISNSPGQNLFVKYQVLNSSATKLGVAVAMFAC